MSEIITPEQLADMRALAASMTSAARVIESSAQAFNDAARLMRENLRRAEMLANPMPKTESKHNVYRESKGAIGFGAVKILQALHASAVLLSMEELENQTGYSPSTLRTHLPVLIRAAYAHKSGKWYGITGSGTVFIQTHAAAA